MLRAVARSAPRARRLCEALQGLQRPQASYVLRGAVGAAQGAVARAAPSAGAARADVAHPKRSARSRVHRSTHPRPRKPGSGIPATHRSAEMLLAATTGRLCEGSWRAQGRPRNRPGRPRTAARSCRIVPRMMTRDRMAWRLTRGPLGQDAGQ